MKKYKQKGFTLIEVMIVVAIIGILASIAYPSYDEYVKRGNRTEGQAFLSDIAARQERQYTQTYKYVTDIDKINELGLSGDNAHVSETGKYTLGLAGGGGGYTLTANNQFNDAKCATLTLNAQGVRGSTGTRSDNNECWR